MIKAKFKRSEDRQSLILTVKGHANQAEYGKDIVCASATILAYALAEEVGEMYEAGKLQKQPTLSLAEGNINILCKPREDGYLEAMQSFKTIQAGYALLANNYPQYVETICFDEG